MKINYIMNMPTEVCPNQQYKHHESTLRAYQILEKVKYYLSNNVPSNIIMELIEEMENKKVDDGV